MTIVRTDLNIPHTLPRVTPMLRITSIAAEELFNLIKKS